MSHAIDTNVAVYGMLGQNADKTDRALAIIQDAVISVQVLSELTNTSLRKFRLPMTRIDLLIEDLVSLGQVRSLTAEVTTTARRLTESYQLSYYDAQIMAAALDAGCSILYSEDGQHEQDIEGLQIRNPFLAP